jgi:hypothetical protein
MGGTRGERYKEETRRGAMCECRIEVIEALF